MHPYAQAVAKTALDHDLIAPSSRVLVALSGGPDSCALLLALAEAAEAGLLPAPVGAAHFHHGLRGRDADEDAAFAAALCAGLRLPCTIGLGAVARERETAGSRQSPHDAARRSRYAFLAEAARERGADTIATAHTADDQAETVLLRLLRGTGPDGLAGIPWERVLEPGIRVARPIREMSRAEGEAYCRARGVTPRIDPSNEKRDYTRARVRSLLPELERDFNPRLREALRRLAAAADADARYFEERVQELWERWAVTAPGWVRLDARLGTEAVPLRRRVLRRALRAVAPGEENAVSEASLRITEDLLLAGAGAADLPGCIRAGWADEALVVERPITGAKIAPYESVLPVPGRIWVPGIGLHLRAEWTDAPPEARRRSLSVVLGCGTMTTGSAQELCVRSPREGDRIAPLGMRGGSRPVRDVMADAGWSADLRRSSPLVVDGRTGEILWIVGLAQAESTRVERHTAVRLHIRARWDC